MNLVGLLPFIDDVPAFQQLTANLKEMLSSSRRPPSQELELQPQVQGLDVISSARPYLLAGLYRQLGCPILLLTARAERVNLWTEQLQVWRGSDSILAFPEPDALPYERVPWSRETVSDRISTLTTLMRWQQSGSAGEPPLIVASARALVNKTLPVREFRLGLREYQLGQELDLQRTIALWVAHGYRPVAVVDEPGTFSRRGGLIDILSLIHI